MPYFQYLSDLIQKLRIIVLYTTSVDNGMKVLVNKITNEANKYTYSTISANKSTMETDLLKEFQELFKTETIQSVLINIVVQ